MCHFIAHSHGGNVIVEALPRLLSGKETEWIGRIVTLGTPFIDTSTAIHLQLIRHQLKVKHRISLSLILALTLWLAVIYFFISMLSLDKIDFFWWIGVPVIRVVGLLLSAISRRLRQSSKVSKIPLSKPIILAISTLEDETWKSLSHVRNSKNPLAPNSGWMKYILASYLTNIRRGDEIGRIHGEKRLSQIGGSNKIVVIGFLSADSYEFSICVSLFRICLGDRLRIFVSIIICAFCRRTINNYSECVFDNIYYRRGVSCGYNNSFFPLDEKDHCANLYPQRFSNLRNTQFCVDGAAENHIGVGGLPV